MMHVAVCPGCNRMRITVRNRIRQHRTAGGLCPGSRTPAARPLPLRTVKPARQPTGGGAA